MSKLLHFIVKVDFRLHNHFLYWVYVILYLFESMKNINTLTIKSLLENTRNLLIGETISLWNAT